MSQNPQTARRPESTYSPGALVPTAFGHLHAKFAQVVPCAAHVTQIGRHMKLHQVFTHAAVHEQRTAPRVQIQDAHGNHVDGFNRRECGDILLAVTDVHQERSDGTEQEERSLCDKDNGPRRAHGKNHRRCNSGNKQQLDQHDGATIVHHKQHAIGKNRGIEPQRSAHCPGANVKRRHQMRARRREQDKRRNHQVKHKARLVGANHLSVIGRAARCDERDVNRLQTRSQGKDNIERNDLGEG